LANGEIIKTLTGDIHGTLGLTCYESIRKQKFEYHRYQHITNRKKVFGGNQRKL